MYTTIELFDRQEENQESKAMTLIVASKIETQKLEVMIRAIPHFLPHNFVDEVGLWWIKVD